MLNGYLTFSYAPCILPCKPKVVQSRATRAHGWRHLGGNTKWHCCRCLPLPNYGFPLSVFLFSSFFVFFFFSFLIIDATLHLMSGTGKGEGERETEGESRFWYNCTTAYLSLRFSRTLWRLPLLFFCLPLLFHSSPSGGNTFSHGCLNIASYPLWLMYPDFTPFFFYFYYFQEELGSPIILF